LGYYGYGYSSFGYPKKATVSERKAAAKREVAKLHKKGAVMQPVQIQGRTIARSFWGKAWCTNLGRYSDYSNRLPRGRSYLSSGQVLDLRVEKGRVLAQVMGRRLYKVTVSIDQLPKKRWESIVGECTGHVGSMMELLQGKLTGTVMETVTRPKTGLFPSSSEIHLDCSCPDWATMCKHVAATLYGIGARLDQQPELLFVLRGVDAADLMVSSGAADALTGQAQDKALGAESSELADLFGIEMESDVDVRDSVGRASRSVVAKKPAAKKPAAKKPAAKKPAAKKPAAKKPAAKKPAAKKPAAKKPAAKKPAAKKPAAKRGSDGYTLVTRNQLEASGITTEIVGYWVNQGLLMTGPSKDTWIATPLAVRRMESFQG
jgi:uncharacterized Zn finger protein